jgi:four helix bundle protein
MEGEDIKYRAYKFSVSIIHILDQVHTKQYSTEVMLKQLIRSSTSIGANIVEGQAGSSRKDFTNFYLYALKSANETKYWLALLRDTHKLEKTVCTHYWMKRCR